MKITIEITPPSDFYEQGEEEEFRELEYAGVTASWLHMEITRLYKCAQLTYLTKYKAATKIQTNFRGWSVRKKILHLHKSATKIQKTWRGFIGRILYFKILDTTLHMRIAEHYKNSATLIQKTFRGYYSRKYIHDHIALRKLQHAVASELLECIAIQTRNLLRNQQLPGILSLRNSRCLMKVDKLLASLKVTRFNQKTRHARIAEVIRLSRAFEKSIRNKDRTEVPFGTECGQTFFEEDIDPAHLKRSSNSPSMSQLSISLYRRDYEKKKRNK